MTINTNDADIILKSSGRINLINKNVDYNGDCVSVLLSTRIAYSPLIFFSQAQADAMASSRLRWVFQPKTLLALVVSA